MFRHQIWILLLFALISTTAFAGAQDKEQDKETVVSTLGWGAAVSDVGRLHLEDIAQDKSGAWAVIHVTASPLSGHAIFSGSRVDPRTGNLLPGSPTADMQGIQVIKLVNGIYSVSKALTPDAQALAGASEQEYHWESNAFRHDPNWWTNDSDAAFIGSHESITVAVCRINPDKTGADRFTSTCVIPNEWEPFVLPAVQFYQQHPAAFTENNTVKGNPAMVGLLHSSNPFLAAAACRALAQAGYFSPASGYSLVKQAQGVQQALFAYLLLHFSPRASESGITGMLGSVAETAATSEQLHPVALAVYVRHQETFLMGEDRNLPPLFDRIDRKAALLDPDPQTSGDASAKSIDLLLKSAQVRKQAITTLSP